MRNSNVTEVVFISVLFALLVHCPASAFNLSAQKARGDARINFELRGGAVSGYYITILFDTSHVTCWSVVFALFCLLSLLYHVYILIPIKVFLCYVARGRRRILPPFRHCQFFDMDSVCWGTCLRGINVGFL